MTDGITSGAVIFAKVLESDAPSVDDASSNEESIDDNPAITDCVMSGTFLTA